MPGHEEDAAPGDRVARSAIGDLHCTGVPATPGRLPPLRRELTVWATASGMTHALIEALVLATDEAMANAVNHAYASDSPGTFDLHAAYHPRPNTVQVTVRDRGRWQEAAPDPGPLGGRGLILIRALAHETVIEPSDAGTTVRMTWRLS